MKKIKDVYYSSHYDVTNQKFIEFVNNYTKLFNVSPNIEAYLAYDAAGIFLKPLKKQTALIVIKL